jgi:3',5'-cyclic AMP phosphodiesterase CpdA
MCLLSLSLSLSLHAKDRWRFVVSGDSRNCGDVVMPEIATATTENKARFYWHLGDFRAIYAVDEDYAAAHKIANPKDAAVLADYQKDAWADFTTSQLQRFKGTPVFLGLGNHELIPPMTHASVLVTFIDWFNAPTIRKQREHDSKDDTTVQAYYHWTRDHIDFITLDNASGHFEDQQLKWFEALLQRDAAQSGLRAIVVGMHEALPESIAKDHSMSSTPAGEASGLQAYHDLLDFQQHSHKPIYTLASHSHFYMAGIFNNAYWKANGGALPGWIIGTAGAVRYTLPPNAGDAQAAKTHVYGYMIGHVTSDNANPIQFEFRELPESSVPPDVLSRFTPDLVHWCWVSNPPVQ